MDWQEQRPIDMMGIQARVHRRKVSDGLLTVIIAREPYGKNGKLGWHLSIAHKGEPSRIPIWEEIKEARYRFCPDDINMAMILPPKDHYVNFHETTMHLYEIETFKGGKAL